MSWAFWVDVVREGSFGCHEHCRSLSGMSRLRPRHLCLWMLCHNENQLGRQLSPFGEAGKRGLWTSQHSGIVVSLVAVAPGEAAVTAIGYSRVPGPLPQLVRWTLPSHDDRYAFPYDPKIRSFFASAEV